MPIGSCTVSSALRRVSLSHETHPCRRFLTSQFRSLQETGAPVDIHPEVEEALSHNKPVVALESTIITHGMPYPTSIDMARSVENTVRSTGCIPATIGIIDGRVKIGLEPSQLERLASRSGNPLKISRRDISAAIVSERDGGTTCSSTLIFAALAGIRVFATGGLGGVHRGGENTLDVSADLHELTRCSVGLVCAGVKSILDIGRTLEYLETLGVPVISYRETKDFPAFYSRKSGHQAPWNVTNAIDAARVLYTHRQLGMTNGALFAVPIPEKYEANGAVIQEAVELAVRESEESGISKLGKEVTPWLLKRVGELTQGRSLESNVALVRNTALIGGQIAREYANLAWENEQTDVRSLPSVPIVMLNISSFIHTGPSEALNDEKASIVVVGCAAVDITSKVQQTPTFSQKTTHPGKLTLTLGGVARNIAEAAHRVLAGSKNQNAATLLMAPVGEDIFGRLITDLTRSMGMRTDGLSLVPGQQSAVCNVLLDAQGGLETGIADMDLSQLWKGSEVFSVLRHHRPRLLVLDGNISSETMSACYLFCSVRLLFTLSSEPTSVTKSTRILPAIAANLGRTPRSLISYASPNLLELGHLYEEARTTFDLMSHDHWWRVIDGFSLGSSFRMELDQLGRAPVSDKAPELGDLSFLVNKGVVQMAINLLPFFQHLVIKCGEHGVVVVMRLGDANVGNWSMERSNLQGRYIVAHSQVSAETIVVQHFPPIHIPPGTVVNTTGAGDTLVGTLLAMLVRNPKTFLDVVALRNAIDISQQAATLTLQSSSAVSPLLSSLSMQPLQ
ncbi:indigoidine synthase A-like protein [Pisolithus orientalis]|uniref:indigoidine synthase A-like protein n=1 Tax=Pisolithus orientalis TaxID=936130 RepID=UPI002225636B|nr:indigoidine synthase A-like protein [Pisolithus orientalis]KAI6008229.1 indigoidine synthase A-like protein [Pisolithus orientalis]